MRTTVNLDDRLLELVKDRAQLQGRTLGEVIEEALQRFLAVDPASRPDVPLPVSTGGTGLRPGVDPRSNRSLYDALDDEAADRHA